MDQKLSSEKNSDRQELIQLCVGLRFVRLPCTSTPQVQLSKTINGRMQRLINGVQSHGDRQVGWV